MRRFLPLVILLGFFLELAVIIAVGRQIGVLATLLLIVGGGVAGGAVIRSAGLGLAGAVRAGGMRVTTEAAAAGFLYILAGLLLIVPGFISDVFGLMLLPARVRLWLARKFMDKIRPASWRGHTYPGNVIEGEAIEIENQSVNRPDPARDG